MNKVDASKFFVHDRPDPKTNHPLLRKVYSNLVKCVVCKWEGKESDCNRKETETGGPIKRDHGYEYYCPVCGEYIFGMFSSYGKLKIEE